MATAERERTEYPGAIQTQPIVRIKDVQKAGKESFNTALLTAASFVTSLQALLLVTLAALSRSTGRESGGFDINEIMMKMDALSSNAGDPQYTPPPSFRETVNMLNRLGEVCDYSHLYDGFVFCWFFLTF